MKRCVTTTSLVLLLALLAGAEARAQSNSPRWQGGEGGLVFMADESDFSPIDLRCERGGVVLSVASPEDPHVDDFIFANVYLSSGKQAGHYRAKVVGDLESRFEFKTTLQDPVLRAFRKTTHISIRGEPELIATTKLEQDAIERFFATCHRESPPSP